MFERMVERHRQMEENPNFEFEEMKKDCERRRQNNLEEQEQFRQYKDRLDEQEAMEEAYRKEWENELPF